MKRLLLLAAFAVSSLALADEKPMPPEQRPNVFRCVLDGHPRMLVIQNGDLFLAYDTEHATLVKAWQGKVDFTGTVYDTRHGPQPLSKGQGLLPRPSDLTAPTYKSWAVGTKIPTLRFVGYAFDASGWSLNYGFDGEVAVREYCSLTVGEKDTLILKRKFVSDRVHLALTLPASAAIAKQALVHGEIALQTGEILAAGADLPKTADTDLKITFNGTIELQTTFIRPVEAQ